MLEFIKKNIYAPVFQRQNVNEKTGYFSNSYTVNKLLWKTLVTARLKGGGKWAFAHE